MNINELKKLTFKRFVIRKFYMEDTILGDLASDIGRDDNFPDTRNIKEIEEYIEKTPMCFTAKDAIEELLSLYKKYYIF